MLLYNTDDMFLYEIIDDYKECDTHEGKDEIFQAFMKAIWSCDNKRRVYTKSFKFTVKPELLHTEIGQIFDTWSDVRYKAYKAMTKEQNWCSLIRQKINNLYTRYFDSSVILNREYMLLLRTPQNLYHEWISGIDMEADSLTSMIDDALNEAEMLRIKFAKYKMVLPWSKYKKIIETFLKRCFDNSKGIAEYEDKSSILKYDCLSEDHFYVGYICKSLEGEMLTYQKSYYGVRQHKKYRRCNICGDIIEIKGPRQKYCSKCKTEKQKEWQRTSMRKLRSQE